jgi:rhodanese-related sulfurtransferase
MKQLLHESLALLAFATGAALAFNAFSPAGIAVTRALPLRELDDRFLSDEEAKARYDAGRTIFVDARKPDEFARGCIEGALSLSVESFAARYDAVARLLPREADLVVYCGGVDCAQSRALADRLELAGHPRERVRIFRGGWKAWAARGWPARRGEAP